MCEISLGALMVHSTFQLLHNSKDQHVDSELLGEPNLDNLHYFVVNPMWTPFWQYPLCNVSRLWQPDEINQLLLGLVKDLLHWLLRYVKPRNVKDQFDNRFTLVPWYPALQRFGQWFNSMKLNSGQGQEIRGIIRTLVVNCTTIFYSSKDNQKTAAETSSDEMVMGAVRSLCSFSQLVSQQNHFDLSLTALHNALKGFCQTKGTFRE